MASNHSEGPAADPFGHAEARYMALREERRAGRMTPPEFRAAVRALAVKDAEDRDWTIGPENGLWYRRDKDRWAEAEPPRRLVCPACGHHNLHRHSYCVECGQRLQRAGA